ncbi:MAG: hypothetical protein LBU04_06420 [Christensenellaceae bacterium]|jgi:glycerophosphoryl diester phosphodiesterase|nr:hypothetical protein [Christensenellaceae bacterium]
MDTFNDIYDIPIAHRGLHNEEIPENTIQAYSNAVSAGYNIELDVRLLKDGEVVVLHDRNLKRLLNIRTKITHLTSNDIKQDRYRLPNGEYLVLFKDLVELIDGKVSIICEIKKSPAVTHCRLEKAVYEIIRSKPWIVVQSFNPTAIEWFRLNAPEVRRGMLATKAKNIALRLLYKLVNPYKVLENTKPEFLAYDIKYLPSKRIAEAVKNYNLQLIAWTVNSNELVKRALENGVRQIIFEDIDPSIYIKKETK